MLNNQTIPVPVLIEDLGMQFPKETSNRRYRYSLYKCSCGNEFKSRFGYVEKGTIKSCGCYNKSYHTTHGFSKHRLYPIWDGMMRRCNSRHRKAFKDYGGRGVMVCERWKDIANFIEDMYPSYQDGLTIDRIDNNGNYEPNNCRWVAMNIQARNTRPIRVTNRSGYRGVSKHGNGWRAQIVVNNIHMKIGTFKSPLEAAKAYDSYVIENNLEHITNGVIKS